MHAGLYPLGGGGGGLGESFSPNSSAPLLNFVTNCRILVYIASKKIISRYLKSRKFPRIFPQMPCIMCTTIVSHIWVLSTIAPL